MRRIIYSKFSNDRSPAYKIRTDIYEDNDKRFVVKAGVGDEGKKHIAHVFSLYESLKGQTKDTVFDINKSTLINGDLNLEYLYGDTLEKKLDDALFEKKYDDFKELIKTYTDNVRAMADTPFEKSREYLRVFGEKADMTEGSSMSVSDIDIIFANVVITDQKWTIIDYEWSFEFKVPVDFILFRTIHYYATPDRDKALCDIDLYELMGVDKEKLDVYEAMEQCFQDYIISDNTPLWRLYDMMGEPYYDMPGFAEKKRKAKPSAVKMYENEEPVVCRIKNADFEDGTSEAIIELDDKVKSIMFFPAYESVVIKVLGVYGHTDSTAEDTHTTTHESSEQEDCGHTESADYEAGYLYNGVSYEDNTIFFKDDNPYIVTDDIRKGTTSITVKYKMIRCGEAMGSEMNNVFALYPERNNLVCENENLKIEKENIKAEDYQVVIELQAKEDALEQTIDTLEKNIAALKNSTSWKVTKPIRRLKGFKE